MAHSQGPYSPRTAGGSFRDFPASDSQSHLLSDRDRIPQRSSSASPAASEYFEGPYLSATLNSSSLRPRSGASVANTISPHGISDKFSLSPDPRVWGSNLSAPEADDALHDPDPKRDRKWDRGGTIFTLRGFANIGCLLLLLLGITTLFLGYPLISHFERQVQSNNGGFNLGGTNATGQVPSFIGNWGMIDLETPQDAYTLQPFTGGGDAWELVFSDEFNTENRTFYPGDDPYWEAVDLHYWATGDSEWYDPRAITTRNGSLEITFSAEPQHNLNYTGGMMSTWNKFCFTGGLVVASVSIPGDPTISGFWPAVWALGNLGRAGYGATLDGLWPYSYDMCDVGTVANQSTPTIPANRSVLLNPDQYNDDTLEPLSFLGGQRLSRCTCAGESHPGPMHNDNTFVGRGAPEIDMFEAQVKGTPLSGQVSQSGQWAPFNWRYQWDNTTENYNIPNPEITVMNSYLGSDLQQSTSAVTNTNQDCYTGPGKAGCYETYGFEYKPGYAADDAASYISWISSGELAWTLEAAGVGADSLTEISARPIPQEPMYLIMNLGMSSGFEYIMTDDLTFPAYMRVDWIRVYQDPKAKNIGCDPPDFPTAAYINQYIEAYTDYNLTTWVDDYKQQQPTNSFLGQC